MSSTTPAMDAVRGLLRKVSKSALLPALVLATASLLTSPMAHAQKTQKGQMVQKANMSIIFAGDVMLDDGPGQTIAAGGDPLAPFDALLRTADYRIGNLECSIAGPTSGKAMDNKIYSFRASPESVRVLKGRFDAMGVANNHSGDFGPDAFLETTEHVNAAGIRTFGGGRNATEAHAPLMIERNGLRIAVLAYNEFKPRSFEAGARHPGIAWSEDTHVIADIRAARKAGADVVIPFMHWGWEREPLADARQRALARKMIDAGASVVVGSHPHVTQDIEYYKGKLIVYSLGNFVFDGFELAEAKVGWLLKLNLNTAGLVQWSTRVARMDLAGTPFPDAAASSPCGKAGDKSPRQCANGAW